MPSIRRNSFFRTLRFRLAMQHVLLLSAALFATFVITLVAARSFAKVDVRHHLNIVLEQAQAAYLGDRAVDRTVQLPEALLERLDRRFPNVRIGTVELEAQPGGVIYEITGFAGNEWLEILAEPDGRIWVADRQPLEEVYARIGAALRGIGIRGVEVWILSPEGEILQGVAEEGVEALAKSIRAEGAPTARVRCDGRSEMIAAERTFDGNVVCVGVPSDVVARTMRFGSLFFLSLACVFLPLAGWIGFRVSRLAMAGVERVTNAVGRLGAGNFSARVESGSEGSEIEALAEAFNGMAERIETLMRELCDVTVNIAHDLRTPLARIRGRIESVEWSEASPSEREEAAAAALEECDRIAPLIDSVLELARAEAGLLKPGEDCIDLAAEVRAAHAVFSAVAEDRRLTFECRTPEGAVESCGDRVRLQRIVSNLVDNALKFAPEGGRVELVLERAESEAVLRVLDNGPGIPPEERVRVFERFYRGDRSRAGKGYGLGLSMAAAFVRAFGGTIEIRGGRPGCEIVVRLPLRRRNA